MARNWFLTILRKNVPLLLVSGGVINQYLFRDYLGNRVFVYLYPLVFIGALLGPITSGLISVIVASLAICYLFLPPIHSFAVETPSDYIGVVVFALTGFFFHYLVKHQSVVLKKQAVENIAQFESLADSMPQLAWMARPDGFIYWYNQGWYHYTGTTSLQMEGWGWQSVHHGNYIDTVMKKWPESIQSGRPFEMEFPILGADKKFRWFLTRAIPIRDKTGKIIRWFGTNTDIDILKKAITLRDEFITLASHEFKTPITSLKLNTQMFKRLINLDKRTGPTVEKQHNYLETNLIQLNRLNVLVDELLDVSRIDMGKLHYDIRPTDLKALTEKLIHRFHDEFTAQHCSLSFTGPQPVMVLGDVYRLEQVIVNIFSNALKFSAGKPVEISVREANGFGELMVRDHGIGIGKEFQEKIFERFERGVSHEHIAGLGLGLYIAREMVNLHKGSIEVESELGHGATFLVKIPLVVA